MVGLNPSPLSEASFFCYKKMGQTRPLFVYFCSFLTLQGQYSTNLTIHDKDSVLGSRTQGGRVEGADGSTELWQHPSFTSDHCR